jgi:hypothetical protein
MHRFTHVNGRFALDWVGRTETLEADLKMLSDRLDLGVERVASVNVRRESPAQDTHLPRYTRDAVQWVNETYREDFELFGYRMVDPSSIPSVARTDSHPATP